MKAQGEEESEKMGLTAGGAWGIKCGVMNRLNLRLLLEALLLSRAAVEV
jgi:hypothetical protein